MPWPVSRGRPRTPRELGVALGVGQLVGVHVTHGADDGLSQLLAAELEGAEEPRGAVVGLESVQEVGVCDICGAWVGVQGVTV